MAKLTLLDLDSLQSETTAIQTINENNDRIERAIENTLSRDGTTPNQLGASLDANSQRIINLPPPEAGSDAARLVDVLEVALPDIAIPALTGNQDKLLSNDGSTLIWLEPDDIPGLGDMQGSNNLSELTDTAVARTNLGLGSSAVKNIGTSGSTVPTLDGANTWSSSANFNGSLTASGGFTLTGSTDARLQINPATLNTDSIGYRGAPQNIQDAAYTLTMSDAGKTIVHTSASPHTWAIPDNVTVALPIGTVIALLNIGSGVLTIARAVGVSLRANGSATDQDTTVNQHNLRTLYKASANSWYIS